MITSQTKRNVETVDGAAIFMRSVLDEDYLQVPFKDENNAFLQTSALGKRRVNHLSEDKWAENGIKYCSLSTRLSRYADFVRVECHNILNCRKHDKCSWNSLFGQLDPGVHDSRPWNSLAGLT